MQNYKFFLNLQACILINDNKKIFFELLFWDFFNFGKNCLISMVVEFKNIILNLYSKLFMTYGIKH